MRAVRFPSRQRRPWRRFSGRPLLRRRCRELLAPAGVADRELVSYCPAPESWSALQHVVHLADALHVAAGRLAKVRTLDRPPLAHMPAVPPGGVQDDQNVQIALALVTDSCSRFAGEIDQTRAEEWSRVGVRSGKEVSALEVAREAVHEGAHHLRDIERVLSEMRAEHWVGLARRRLSLDPLRAGHLLLEPRPCVPYERASRMGQPSLSAGDGSPGKRRRGS